MLVWGDVFCPVWHSLGTNAYSVKQELHVQIYLENAAHYSLALDGLKTLELLF